MPDYKLRIIVEGIDKATAPLNNIKSSLGDIGKIALGAGLGDLLAQGLSGAVSGLASVARGALDSYAAYERLGMSINSLAAKEALLTGQATSMQDALAQTSGKSQELLGWIQKLAIESPFRQEDVAGAFRLSMALGFGTAEAQRLTQAMLNFSTATGSGGETIERIARALGQMRTKGRVSLEEINQLTESGVDAMRILADATGMTGQELTKAISKGAVDANTAIEAILADTERLYANAGKNSAESMSGLLSTLGEIGELSSRNLFAGMFKEAQPYIASIVGVLTAPEFQAGIQNWGTVLGGFTADTLQGAAEAMERIDAAIAPLLDKGAPLWLTGLQALAAAGGTPFVVDIKPTVTELKTPDGGLKIAVTPTATTITNPDGGLLRVDVVAGKITVDADTTDEIPPVNLVADWKQGTIGSLIAADWTNDSAERHKILLKAGWEDGWQSTLQAAMDLNDWMAGITPYLGMDGTNKLSADVAALALPSVKLGAQWAGNAIGDLWQSVQDFFSTRPVTVDAQGTIDVVTMTGTNKQKAIDDYVDSLNLPVPNNATFDPYTGPTAQERYEATHTVPTRHKAKGGPAQGWTIVGEEGPELAYFGGAGAHIFSNPDTKALLKAGIPGFAEGTTDIPGWLQRMLSSAGLWVPQASTAVQYGPQTREQALGWQNFQRQGTQAMQQTAKQTGEAFESAAQDTNDAFKSALQGVPGLFGTSQVTADQMRMADLGIPQNFADDYLRRLNDEVLNGVDWEGVDITDAANRAGIDPNLPANVILELFKNAWNDSSLFANAGNLDLINQDAVKAAIEQQQKELSGKANLMQLFGITDENLQGQADALGAGLASVFGKATETDAMKAAGAQAFAAIGEGFGDSNTAVAAVGGMAQAVITATGTPENAAALEDAGKAAAFSYYGGWKSYMAEAVPPPPTGSATSATGTPVGHNALGTANWRGGWTVVGEHGPELVDLPSGAAVYDANTTRRMRGKAARPVVVNQTFVVNGKLMAEQAAQRAVQLIRRGG